LSHDLSLFNKINNNLPDLTTYAAIIHGKLGEETF